MWTNSMLVLLWKLTIVKSYVIQTYFIKEIMFGILNLNVMFGMLYSKVRTGFEMGFKNPSIPSRSRKEIAFSLLFLQGRIY